MNYRSVVSDEGNKKVIEAYELAPAGVVTMVYPLEGNQKRLEWICCSFRSENGKLHLQKKAENIPLQVRLS